MVGHINMLKEIDQQWDFAGRKKKGGEFITVRKCC